MHTRCNSGWFGCVGILFRTSHALEIFELGNTVGAFPELSPLKANLVRRFCSHPIVAAYRRDRTHLMLDQLLLRLSNASVKRNTDDKTLLASYLGFIGVDLTLFLSSDNDFFLSNLISNIDGGLDKEISVILSDYKVFQKFYYFHEDDDNASRYVRGLLNFLRFMHEAHFLLGHLKTAKHFQSSAWSIWAPFARDNVPRLKLELEALCEMVTLNLREHPELMDTLFFGDHPRTFKKRVNETMTGNKFYFNKRRSLAGIVNKLHGDNIDRKDASNEDDLYRLLSIGPIYKYAESTKQQKYFDELIKIVNWTDDNYIRDDLAFALELELLNTSGAINGWQHKTTGLLFNNFGVLLQKIGLQDLALKCYTSAMNILRKDRLIVASILTNIARVHASQNLLDEALAYDRRALAIFDALDDRSSSNAATVSNNIGEMLRRKGDYPGALPFLQRAAQIGQARALPKSSIWNNNLAVLLALMENFDESERVFSLASQVAEGRYGIEHEYTRKIRYNYDAMRVAAERAQQTELKVPAHNEDTGKGKKSNVSSVDPKKFQDFQTEGTELPRVA